MRTLLLALLLSLLSTVAHADADCGPAFAIVAGPAVSATDPHPSDFYRPGDVVKVGAYVAVKVTPSGGGNFKACTVTNSAYKLAADGSRQVLTQSDLELKANQGIFYKSWKLIAPGSFLIEVREATTRRVLATYPVTVKAE